MAESMTFTSLQEDIRRYIERGYTSADTQVYDQIPRLITLAERAIARAIKVQGFIEPLITTLSSGVSVYAKPARWRETVSMNIGTGLNGNTRRFVYPRSYEYCRNYWPDSDQTDLPEFYADYDYDHWLIVPTPAADYNWEIIIYQIPPLLGEDNQTNWLTDYAPNALLYRCLLEAAPFLKDDERINTWKGLYDAELATLDVEDLKNIASRASVRTEN